MAKSNKRRLSVPLSLDVYSRLETDAEKTGVSPSAFVCFIINDYYKNIDMSKEVSTKVMSEMFGSILEKMGYDGEKLVNDGINEQVDNLKKLTVKQNDKK